MQNPRPLLVLFILAMFAAPPPLAAGEHGFSGHTSPIRWERPRVFHEPFAPGAERSVKLERAVTAEITPGTLVLSPNGAYWYALQEASTGGTRLIVYNEEDRHILVTLTKRRGKSAPEIRWINEKLLYGEIWHGRIYGESFVLDVEQARLLTHERVVWGQIHFQQWQASCPNFPDLPSCQKD